MEVLLVTDGYPPTPGGLEGHVGLLARFLHGAGHSIRVVTASPVEDNDDPWTVLSAPTRLANIPGLHQGALRQLPPPWPDRGVMDGVARCVATKRPDVIHSHGWCAASAGRVAQAQGIPHVVTLHDYGLLCPMRTLLNNGASCSHTASLGCLRCVGSDQSAPKRLVLAAGIRRTFRHELRVSSFIAVSAAVARAHQRAGLREPLDVIPNFVVEPAVQPAPFAEQGTVLFVGPDEPYKGWPIVDAARQMLIERGRSVVFQQVGGSSRSSVPNLERSGRLTGEALQAAYDRAWMVLVPSTWEEPFATVALEAMASGRAVIASAVGGLRDIVDDGVTGLLVPPSDPVALADAIDALWSDPARREAMGRAGRDRVQDFTIATIGPRLEAHYERALAGGATAQ